MKIDPYGQAHFTCDEICDLLYKNPDLDLKNFQADDPHLYNKAIDWLYVSFPRLQLYAPFDVAGIQAFDQVNQLRWYMPTEYKDLDIAEWVLSNCKTDEELQRVAHELLLYQERDLFNLLRFMKYLVDTLRKNNIVWGVGRGSSVASYVLYLIGVHKINSIYYDLDITEFLK